MSILKTLKFIYQYLLNIWSGSLIYEDRNLLYPPQIVDGKLTFANQDELSLGAFEINHLDAEFRVAVRFLKMRYSFYVTTNCTASRFGVIVGSHQRRQSNLSDSTIKVTICNMSEDPITIPPGTYLFQIKMNNPNWHPRICLSQNPNDFAL